MTARTDEQMDKRRRHQCEGYAPDGSPYLAKVRVAGSNPVVRSKKSQVRSPFHESLWSVIHLRSVREGFVVCFRTASNRRRRRGSGGVVLVRQGVGRVDVEIARVSITGHIPSVVHPVVRVHPETGRKLLYVCGTFTTRIAWLNEAESATLLAYLFSYINNPEVHCRYRRPVRWRCGTTARPSIWLCPIASKAGSCTAPMLAGDRACGPLRSGPTAGGRGKRPECTRRARRRLTGVPK